MTTDSISTIRAAQDAARQLTDTERQLRERHAALVRERGQVRYGNASEAECLANVDRLVDDRRAAIDDMRGELVRRALSGYLQPRTSLGGTARDQRIPPHLPTIGDAMNANALTFDDLCWLAADVVKDALKRVVRAGTRFGLPPKERADRLATLEREIADVERQHTELVSAAGDVGITLQLLDTVRKQREEQQRR